MKNLGRYKILKEIGRGAMGIVYQGFDPEIDRVVAIKVVRAGQSEEQGSPQAVKDRFEREIRIVGQLHHPNIVMLHDAGEAEGTRFFVMEYVEGRTLASLIRSEQRLPLDRTLHILEKVAAGVSYAHDKGVIHCDIKAANILIATDGAVKITDFGIARWHTLTGNGTRSLTGTPAYISPEQVSGHEVARTTDVFSLGVLAYELLTGTLPFRGETVTRIIQQVLHETPVPPSRLNPELPEALDGAVMTALEKSPGKRFQDVPSFLGALRASVCPGVPDKTLAGDLVSRHQPEKEDERAGRRRPSLRAALAVAAFLAVVVPLARFLVPWGPEDGGVSSGQAYARGMTLARTGNVEDARQSFESLLRLEGQEDRGLVGMAYLNLREGRGEEAGELLGRALALNPQNLYAHVLQAQMIFQDQDPARAAAVVNQALERYPGADWERAEAYALRGRVLDVQGRAEEALDSYEQAIRLDPTNPSAYANKGALLSRLGNYPGAAASYRDLFRVSEDPSAGLLAEEYGRRTAFEADERKRERIRSLIAELDGRQEKPGKPGAPPVPDDPWTSRPLTVCLYPLAERGLPSLDGSAGLYLQARLAQGMGADPRLSPVDRELLDGILQELNLALSDLADPAKALRVGRIAGARLLVTGSVFHLGGRLQTVLQVVETETTYVKAALSDEQRPGETLTAFGDRVAGSLSDAVETAFPLQGRIRERSGDEVTLDLGARVGAREGVRFQVLPPEGEPGRTRKAYTGIVVLTRVMEEASLASVEEEYDPIGPGQRVAQIRE